MKCKVKSKYRIIKIFPEKILIPSTDVYISKVQNMENNLAV